MERIFCGSYDIYMGQRNVGLIHDSGIEACSARQFLLTSNP